MALAVAQNIRILVLFAGVLIVALLTCGVVGVNAWQLGRYLTVSKLQGRASPMALAAWIISLVSWFTGPLVLVGAPVSIVMGAIQMRPAASPPPRLAGQMAILNGIWIMIALVVVGALTLNLKHA